MNTKKVFFLLSLIVFLAALLRLYNLSFSPPSLNWDEAAIGWNAKSIFFTRRDEYGTRLPLVFQSFGDYKAPLYIYLTSPIVGFFGLNEITIRSVSVLSGIASVLVIYLLTKELLKKKSTSSTQYPVSLIAALLLSITPWSVMFSRGAFEQNLALFFILAGSWFFLKALKQPKYLVLCVLPFALALYTYHSPKIFLPLFLIALTIIYRRKLFSRKFFPAITGASIFGLVLLTPLVYSTFSSGATKRFQSTSIFYQNDIRQPINLQLISKLVSNYLVHYSSKFYYSGSQENFRTQLNNQGLMLWITAPFLILGLIQLIKSRQKPWAKFLLVWLLIGPTAAVIGKETPHPIRAMNILPALLIVTSLGVTQFINKAKKPAIYCLAGLTIINLAFFLHHYFTQYPIYSAPDWQYGYKQVVDIAKQYENNVDKIVISGHYGQPHVFTMVYQDRDPVFVFFGGMIKYIYYQIKWFDDSAYKDVLLIGSPEEIPEHPEGFIAQIDFPDGSPAFRVVKTRGDKIF